MRNETKKNKSAFEQPTHHRWASVKRHVSTIEQTNRYKIALSIRLATYFFSISPCDDGCGYYSVFAIENSIQYRRAEKEEEVEETPQSRGIYMLIYMPLLVLLFCRHLKRYFANPFKAPCIYEMLVPFLCRFVYLRLVVCYTNSFPIPPRKEAFCFIPLFYYVCAKDRFLYSPSPNAAKK